MTRTLALPHLAPAQEPGEPHRLGAPEARWKGAVKIRSWTDHTCHVAYLDQPPVRPRSTAPGGERREGRASERREATQLSWGARLLWTGHTAPRGFRRAGVDALWVGLDASIRVEVLDTPRHTLRGRAVFVPAGLGHQIAFEGRSIACLYSDPQTDDREALARAARLAAATGGRERRELETMIAALDRAAGEACAPEAKKKAIELALGLRSLTPTDPRMAQAILSLYLDGDDAPPMTKLAREANLSASCFRRAFRRSTGVTFKRYRVWLRLGEALAIAGEGASLTEAAHQSGFSSSAHLSSACRNLFGMTPTEYLRYVNLTRRG